MSSSSKSTHRDDKGADDDKKSAINYIVYSIAGLVLVVAVTVTLAISSTRVIGFSSKLANFLDIDEHAGKMTLTERLRLLCFDECDASTIGENTRVVFNDEIIFKLSNFTLQQQKNGDLIGTVGIVKLLHYRADIGVPVIGSGDLADTMTEAEIEALPRGAVVVTGAPISETKGDWYYTSEIRLGDGFTVRAAKHRRLPALYGLQLAQYGNSKTITLPADPSFPVLIGSPRAEDIAGNLAADVIAEGPMLVSNVSQIQQYDCINNNGTSFFNAIKHLQLRSYVNGLHCGAYGSALDYVTFPLQNSGCTQASIYRHSLRRVLETALAADCKQPIRSLTEIFDNPSYYFSVDTSACIDATAAAVPGAVTFSFYLSPQCNVPPSQSLAVALGTCGASYQLVCSP